MSVVGCATVPSEPAGVVCPSIVNYSKDFLNKLDDELSKITEGSAIDTAFADYQELRDKSRACMGIK